MSSHRCHALVVDDDDLMRSTLRSLCERQGIQVDEAADGLTALALAERSSPDIVITDLAMPGIDGIELTRMLRAAGCRARILVLTGGGTSNGRADVDEALPAGADRVLLKSAGLSVLVQTLRELGAAGRVDPAGRPGPLPSGS